MNGPYHWIRFKKLTPPRKYKKEALLPREIEKFRTEHPEDGDGLSLWNSGEFSYLDAAVCTRRFYWKIRFTYMFITHKLYSAESYITTNAFSP